MIFFFGCVQRKLKNEFIVNVGVYIQKQLHKGIKPGLKTSLGYPQTLFKFHVRIIGNVLSGF